MMNADEPQWPTIPNNPNNPTVVDVGETVVDMKSAVECQPFVVAPPTDERQSAKSTSLINMLLLDKVAQLLEQDPSQPHDLFNYLQKKKRKAAGDDNEEPMPTVQKEKASPKQFLDWLEDHLKENIDEKQLRKLVTDEMNKQFAIIRGEGTFFLVDLCGTTPEGESIYHLHTIDSLKKHMSKYTMRKSSKIAWNPVDMWSQHVDSREYKYLEFDPEMTLDQNTTLNLFTGLKIPRSKATKGDVQPILDHILQIVCRGNEQMSNYFISWLASLVQFPGRKMNSALVLSGAQGAGKTYIFELMEKILGSKYFFMTDSFDTVDGNFQPEEMKTCLLLVYDECTRKSKNDTSQEEKAKSRITNKTHNHNQKFVVSLKLKNCHNVAFCSNGKPVRVEGQDRRYPWFQLDPKYAGTDEDPIHNAYFAKLRAVVPEHFAHFLYNWDLDKFNPRQLPSSEFRRREKLHGADPIYSWVFDWLNNPDSQVEGARTPKELHNAYKTYLSNNFKKADHLVQFEFLGKLRAMFPFAEKKYCPMQPGSPKSTHVMFPTRAECKSHFASFFNEKEWEWEDLEDPLVTTTLPNPFGPSVTPTRVPVTSVAQDATPASENFFVDFSDGEI